MPRPLDRMLAVFHRNQLRESLPQIARRLDLVVRGIATPSLETMPIGSGKKVRAAVIFFDICGFTRLTSSDDIDTLKKTLLLLNCVIPAMMRVLYRYGAYVEKNTGDGLMAILGVETNDIATANFALDAGEEMFYVLHHIANPILVEMGIQPIQARIGIDMGQILISRIGVPNGSAIHPRNSLTAVGPAANLACKIQTMAGPDELWCGDAIRNSARPERLHLFDCVTPQDWTWNYGGNPLAPYHCWRYNGSVDPFAGYVRPPRWP